MKYDPHKDHVARATGPSDWWRIPSVLGIALVGAIFLGQLLFGLLPEGATPLDASIEDSETPGQVALVLLGFLPFSLGLLGAVWILHARGLWAIAGPPAQVLRDFRIVVPWAIAINLVVGFVAPAPGGMDIERSALEFDRWLVFLPLFCVTLAIQTGTEELIFRGYLQQQIAVRAKDPIVWILVPSITFGLLHFDEPGPNSWIIISLIAVYGVAFADLTARTGSIGAAWGMHFAGNFFALGIIAPQDSLSGQALFTYPFDFSEALSASDVLTELLWLFILWLTARVALRV